MIFQSKAMRASFSAAELRTTTARVLHVLMESKQHSKSLFFAAFVTSHFRTDNRVHPRLRGGRLYPENALPLHRFLFTHDKSEISLSLFVPLRASLT